MSACSLTWNGGSMATKKEDGRLGLFGCRIQLAENPMAHSGRDSILLPVWLDGFKAEDAKDRE
jgi:hypothetical protein